MAIFLVYSTSGITSGKKQFVGLKMAAIFENFEILNTASIWPQIWKDRPKLCKKKFFYGDDVIDDVTGWPQNFSLYSFLGEVGSGSKLQGQCLVNKYQYRNCLSRLYMPKDDLNELHFSRLQVKGQHHRLTGWPWHNVISNIANYLKYNYFLDCDGIDNVTLRLWKFSDFCSRLTVGVAGDDIMFHILVGRWKCLMYLVS